MNLSAAAHPLLQDPDFGPLKQHIIESTGLAYYADKDADLATRISVRLAQLTLKGCGAYLALLRNREAGEAERHLLIFQLTIGETYFFRYSEQFDALRDVVLPEIIERNQASRTLRIWSAGCAIGAEPYSLAILLKRHFGIRLTGWDVQIIGTDINQAFLARASRGEFDERALRSTPDDVRREWFAQSGATWTINPQLKEGVTFQYHNLVEHPYPSIVHGIVALDLILCRNVMIYFDWGVIERILGRFHECLVDGGWLAVGHAESNTEVFRAYRTVNMPGATFYQKSAHHQVVTYSPVSPAVPTSPLAEMPWLMPDMQLPWTPPDLPAAPHAPAVLLDQPHTAPALTGLALIRRLADEGQWKEAARRCEHLLTHDRLNPSVHFFHALILEQMRHLAEAEQALRRAIYLDRTCVLAHYHLALLLGKAGQRDAAMQSLRNVQSLLSRMRPNDAITDGDGITAEELGQLVGMHVDVLQK